MENKSIETGIENIDKLLEGGISKEYMSMLIPNNYGKSNFFKNECIIANALKAAKDAGIDVSNFEAIKSKPHVQDCTAPIDLDNTNSIVQVSNPPISLDNSNPIVEDRS